MKTYLTGAFVFSSLLFGALNANAFQTVTKEFSWEEASKEYVVTNFTVKDGLPINSVNYIVHHSDGFLYLATNDGLVKFDGIKFTAFTSSNSPELESNRIDWVGSGGNGELWLTDVSDRLYSLRDGELTLIDLNGAATKKLEILSNNEVLITTDSGFLIKRGLEGKFERFIDARVNQDFLNSFVFEGTAIFFLLPDGLYQMIDDEVFLVLGKDEMLIKPESIFNIIQTRDGSLWFLGYSNELAKLSPEKKQERYTYDVSEEHLFWDFIEKNETQLIISTDKGYLEFDRSTKSFSKSQFMTDEQGYFEDNAWMFYKGGVISKLGSEIYIDQKKVLETERRILFLTMDRESSIWVATSGEGLYQIRRKKIVTIGQSLYPNFRNLYGLAEGNAEIYIASFESNVFRISEEGIKNWNRDTSNLNNIFFRSVFIDKDGVVWAGNFNLWFFKDGFWQKDEEYEEDINQLDVIFEDSQDRFWVGTNKELWKRESADYVLFEDEAGQSLNSVTSVRELENGTLVFTTSGQGVAFLDSSSTFKFIDEQDGLSSNLIRDMHYVKGDTLWVVTENKGLNRVVLTKEYVVAEVKTATVNDGLIDNSLHRLIEDKFGFFWINSNKGVMRVGKASLNNYLDNLVEELNIESFGEEDGLIDEEGNGGSQNSGILTKDGKLLFPSQAGLIYTRPEWFINNEGEHIQDPVFEWVSYEGKVSSLLNKKQIELPLKARSAQVKFTVPYFSSPEKLHLQYRMPRVNNRWEDVGDDRLAVFTNLPSGTHRLHVRARKAGSLSFNESSIDVTIPPYYYETSWFILLATILIITALVAGFRLLLRQSRNRESKLNSLVHARTRDLLVEKEKTEEALKRIEELSNVKAAFFTNFTHELRTPLSLILNPLEDMLNNEAPVPPQGEGSLRLMRRNAIRLKELVNKLLDISKLNSNELILRYQKVDIGLVTTQIAHQFEHEFRRKEISFFIQGSTIEKEVFIDLSAWEHVCTNLLANAIKFTPKKGKIELLVGEQVDTVTIEFKDSGIGIAEEELPFIFDPYFQGSSSISKAEGTGIGLALVKGLVESMFGTISVTSETGKGTRFTISLRKGVEHLADEKILSEAESLRLTQKVEEAHSLSLVEAVEKKENKAKVLLVEDNADLREYLESILSATYRVQCAENGFEGLNVITEYQPDIIVSDIMMPEMDGYEMMKAIRSMEAFKHTPFIFLSAKDSPADIEKGLNLGADIYLTKPVQNNVLVTQIKVLLRRENELRKRNAIEEETSLPPLVAQVKEIIKRHLGNPDLNIELIASALAMSSASLYRNWKSVSKETLNTTITKYRFEEAIKLIKEENMTISEASYLVGFSHISYFSRAFKKMYGASPQEYLNK